MIKRQLKKPRLPHITRNGMWCIASLLLVAALVATQSWRVSGKSFSFSRITGSNIIATSFGIVPNLLSTSDVELYSQIFKAMKSGDFAQAKKLEDDVDNRLLMGHVQAERFLSRGYSSSAHELASWLAQYSDLPQADDVYALAVSKSPSLSRSLAPVKKQRKLNGYGDDNGLAAMGDSAPYASLWRAGIEAWRIGRKDEAAKVFAHIADRADKISPWTVSASGYWAWRAYEALGKTERAQHYLNMAAAEPRSFYGILARKQLHRSLGLDMEPISLSGSDMSELLDEPAIRRSIGLVQIGEEELAESELRLQFPYASADQRTRLLALAYKLNLASAQISMGRILSNTDRPLDFARYPIPSWQPEGGFHIDPSLVFALARQESGFRASAVSPGGALGLMQLMPQTASYVQKITNTELDGLVTEPVVNVTLGQDYVRHLLDNGLVEDNLLYMLVAYNAGAGRLQSWKKDISYGNDPLLFIESIPFAETRYYVQQVMANYWIYSELTGQPHHSVYALIHGDWPWYEQRVAPVAARESENNPS